MPFKVFEETFKMVSELHARIHKQYLNIVSRIVIVTIIVMRRIKIVLILMRIT